MSRGCARQRSADSKVTSDAAERVAAFREAEVLLETGSMHANHFIFYRTAIAAARTA